MAVLNSLSDGLSGSLAGRVLIAFGVLLLYPIGIAIRNLYFHPLSKFPGPKLWAASRIPYIVSLLKGDLVIAQQEIHRKYGDVVRMGPNEISFAKDEAWQDLYVHRAGHKDLTKDPLWYKAPEDMPQNIVTTIDPSVHTRMRRLLSSSFTEKSLRSQEPLIESYTDLLITRLRGLATAPTTKGNGVVINVVDWLNYFTVDIIGDLALGESFNCLENSNYHPWVETLNNFLKGMIYAAATRFYPSLEYLFMKMLPKSVMELQRKHAEFVSERINRRLNLEKDRPDFMTPFIKVNADFQQMSLKEIESNFAILIVAGADTTATTLSGTISYLLQTPSAMQKLVSEIRTSFKNEADITVAATKDLPYLDAVINEGLRLCNPVPGGLPRIVQEGGDTFAGHFVPEGISVSIRPYVVSRSERYFAHPDSFIPERWFPLGKRPAEFESDHLSSSNPFSLGHSGCLGKNLAWAEMRIFMARLLWAFDLEEEEGKRVDWTKLKTLVIVQKEPVEVRIKVRKGVEGK